MPDILLLGGTEEARSIAERLDALGADFVTSFRDPPSDTYTYPGRHRSGGFGGRVGLHEYLSDNGVRVLIDATHPFAATISPNAKVAARRARVRYLRVERRPWRRMAQDRWMMMRSLEEAADLIDPGSRVFLAVGARSAAPFLKRRDLNLVLRAIETPDLMGRDDVTVVEARGPFDIPAERELFDEYAFDVMVVKNSGGDATSAKLRVARERGTLTYMVRRPSGQPTPSARNADELMRKLRRHL